MGPVMGTWVCTLAAMLLRFALQRGRFCTVVALRLCNNRMSSDKPNFTRTFGAHRDAW